MKKNYLIMLFLLPFLAIAQDEVCGTETIVVQKTLNFVPDDGKIIVVPVIFHVLYKNDEENIDESHIMAMLANLNKDFLFKNDRENVPEIYKKRMQNPNIEFVAASSLPEGYIIRKKTSTREFDYRKRQAFIESPAYDTDRYLNVYICDANTGAFTPSGVKEYHGIVIDYTNVNGQSRTLTHEAGHWLGLPHPFENGLGGRFCNDGDGIADTPKQKKVFGCVQQVHCGEPLMVNNFMGYGFTVTQECRSFFTKGQVDIMRQTALDEKKFVRRDVVVEQPSRPAPTATVPGSIDFPKDRIGNNAYLDAGKLAVLGKMKSLSGGMGKVNSEKNAILASYNITNDNPFIKEIVSYPQLAEGDEIGVESLNRAFSVKNAEPASPLNWQASVLNGLASFMAGRFKQELLHTGLNQIFRKIVDENADLTDKEKLKVQLVKDLFPKTTEQMKLLYNGGDASYYTADIVFLSQTAKSDLNDIPQRLLKKPEILLTKLNTNDTVYDVVIIATRIFTHTGNGLALPKIIDSLALAGYKTDHVRNFVRLTAMISNGLRAAETDNSLWINPLKLKPEDILTNETVNYFYGLMYAQLSNIPQLKSYLDRDPDKILIARKIQKLLLFVNELNATYDYLVSKEFELKTIEEKIYYVRSINNSFQVFTSTLMEIDEINNVFEISDRVLQTGSDFINIIELFLNKEYVPAINQLTIQLNEYMNGSGAYNRLLLFTSQLASIENGEDMEALLQAYAAPIGSSSIKRSSPSSLSLNGYVGFNLGLETVRMPGDDESGTYWGLSAPIGFAYSFKPWDMKGSFSIFLSAIDLGSLVNIRLENDDTSYGDVRFEHFLSPGLGLSYNFNSIPLTIGVYGSYINNLREIEYNADGTTQILEGKDVTRINVSLLIDIPLLTIYNKKEK